MSPQYLVWDLLKCKSLDACIAPICMVSVDHSQWVSFLSELTVHGWKLSWVHQWKMFGSSERLVSLAVMGRPFMGERTSWKQALSVNVKCPCADEDAHEPCSGSRTVCLGPHRPAWALHKFSESHFPATQLAQPSNALRTGCSEADDLGSILCAEWAGTQHYCAHLTWAGQNWRHWIPHN